MEVSLTGKHQANFHSLQSLTKAITESALLMQQAQQHLLQEFEYSRKFYQELLEPAEGTYAFQAYPHDLQ